MAIYQSLGTWNATTNTPALPAVTSAPTNILPTPDGNYYDYYIVSVSDGAPHSYANAEAGQTYAVGDSVVAIPGTLTWTKNPANPAGGQIVLPEIERPAAGAEGITVDRIIKPSQSFGAPVIVPPIEGQTTVSGTAAFGATIKVTIGASSYTGSITNGAWTVTVPTLIYGQSVTAVAILFGGVETQSASAIVGHSSPPLPPGKPWAYGIKSLD